MGRGIPVPLPRMPTSMSVPSVDTSKQLWPSSVPTAKQKWKWDTDMRKKKWTIVAYPECDEGYLPRKEEIIYADDHDEAMRIAWRTFPEYHEVSAFVME